MMDGFIPRRSDSRAEASRPLHLSTSPPLFCGVLDFGASLLYGSTMDSAVYIGDSFIVFMLRRVLASIYGSAAGGKKNLAMNIYPKRVPCLVDLRYAWWNCNYVVDARSSGRVIYDKKQIMIINCYNRRHQCQPSGVPEKCPEK